jgi:acyl-CoA thioesterase II
MRKVDMTAYNSGRSVVDKRQLQWYSVFGAMPSDQPNLHACAHLYASDRNSLKVIPNFVEVGNDYSAIASLSHTVVFHSEAGELAMVDPDGKKRWFCQEFQVDRVSHGRGFVTSRIWREDGVHVASQSQDGLIRMKGSNERLMGDALTNSLNKKGLMTAREIFGIPGKRGKL